MALLTVDEYVRSFTSETISRMVLESSYCEGMKLSSVQLLLGLRMHRPLLHGISFARYIFPQFLIILFSILKFIKHNRDESICSSWSNHFLKHLEHIMGGRYDIDGYRSLSSRTFVDTLFERSL